MNTDTELENAAYESERDRNYGNSLDERIDAYKAGAHFERERILKLLESNEASVKFINDDDPLGISPHEWADWLQEQLSDGGAGE